MKIISIDPGYDRIGLAVLSKEKGEKETILFSHCIQTEKNSDVSERIFSALKEISKYIRDYEVEVFVIEKLFFSRNTKTALSVSEFRGAAIFLAKDMGLKVYEFTPNQIKLAITGNGNATKKDMFFFIQKIISLSQEKKYIDDEIDAIALGLTFFSYYRV